MYIYVLVVLCVHNDYVSAGQTVPYKPYHFTQRIRTDWKYSFRYWVKLGPHCPRICRTTKAIILCPLSVCKQVEWIWMVEWLTTVIKLFNSNTACMRRACVSCRQSWIDSQECFAEIGRQFCPPIGPLCRRKIRFKRGLLETTVRVMLVIETQAFMS